MLGTFSKASKKISTYELFHLLQQKIVLECIFNYLKNPKDVNDSSLVFKEAVEMRVASKYLDLITHSTIYELIA